MKKSWPVFGLFSLVLVLAALLSAPVAGAAGVLVEAEGLSAHGGWKLDTQFIHEMGSPYLLAHGLGRPVEDASGEVSFHRRTYHVTCGRRTVERWARRGPGRRWW